MLVLLIASWHSARSQITNGVFFFSLFPLFRYVKSNGMVWQIFDFLMRPWRLWRTLWVCGKLVEAVQLVSWFNLQNYDVGIPGRNRMVHIHQSICHIVPSFHLLIEFIDRLRQIEWHCSANCDPKYGHQPGNERQQCEQKRTAPFHSNSNQAAPAVVPSELWICVTPRCGTPCRFYTCC